MSDLVFIAFPNEQKAEEVREKLLAPQKEYLLRCVPDACREFRCRGSSPLYA
jgi:uncharacterized membrane protein